MGGGGGGACRDNLSRPPKSFILKEKFNKKFTQLALAMHLPGYYFELKLKFTESNNLSCCIKVVMISKFTELSYHQAYSQASEKSSVC